MQREKGLELVYEEMAASANIPKEVVKTGEVDYESRPIYKDSAGKTYVDIDLGRSEKPNLHHITPDGEPLHPLKNFVVGKTAQSGPAPETSPERYGEITFSSAKPELNGITFNWMLNKNGTEVWGEIRDKNGKSLPRSQGWWRTADPKKAAQTAFELYLPSIRQ